MKKIFLLSLCILFGGAAFASDDTQNMVKSKAEIKLEQISAKKAQIMTQNNDEKEKIDLTAKAKKEELDLKTKEKISKIEALENKIRERESARLDKIAQKNAAAKAKDDAKNEAMRIKKEAKEARIAAKAQAKELKLNAIAQAKELELRAKEQEKAAIAQAKELKTANKIGKVKVEEKTVVLQEVSKEPVPIDTHIKPVKQLKELNIILTSYKSANFETKKAEIVSGLKLSEKQQAEAQKIYDNTKEKIAAINAQIADKQQEANMVKLSKIDTKTQAERLAKLNGELEILYQKRDKLHNEAMKKFDNILDKEQKEAWDNAKTKGVRLFTELDEIKTPKENVS